VANEAARELKAVHKEKKVMQAAMKAVLVVIGLLGAASCAPRGPTAVDTSADQAAIHAGDQAHVDAYNAGNGDGIIAVYADDAVLMPSGAPVAVGHEAIGKYYTASIAGAKAGGFATTIGDYVSRVSGNLGSVGYPLMGAFPHLRRECNQP
jgi:hypothetical protein